MLNFTFLTKNQVTGPNRLEIFDEICISAHITDFAILLGGYYDDMSLPNNRFGYYWTKENVENGVYCIDYEDDIYFESVRDAGIGTRPIFNYSEIVDFIFAKSYSEYGLTIVEYGEYPQTTISKDMQSQLEASYKYQDTRLKLTGKTYTIDSGKLPQTSPSTYNEYIYEDGKKYIRVIANTCDYNEEYELSNGEKYKNGDYVWVEVKPIKWIIDKKNNIAVSWDILFSGVIFNRDEYRGDFDNSIIKKFMDTHFSKDIIPSKVNTDVNETNDSKKINPYNFDYENVSEEDIIRGMVESNIAVFLHGKSSDGKSARVKELDPDCEIIYLVNSTPDSLNGKTVFNSNTNEMIDIPPTWYIKLKERCENEPDKLHIVFFDELTNAVPSIQSMAFNIVLNKEVNGKWKLPDNARIVAAGNEYEESRAANEMVEPLFNRFAHVYINTTTESWLKWASTSIEEYKRLDYKDESVPMKIHPSIYAYIAYKSYSKQDVLRTPYDGKTPNADPRKWEMSSKVLYKTNNPEMLRSLIGDSLTRDFVMFTKRKVITVEDVINGAYNEEDLEMSLSEKYNTAVGLSSVSIEHIEVVRDFVKRLGPEICATFDTLWTHGDNERLEKIMELEINERTK